MLVLLVELVRRIVTCYGITILKVILVGCKKLSFYINKIELSYSFTLHSRESDFAVTKITITRIPIEVSRIGIS